MSSTTSLPHTTNTLYGRHLHGFETRLALLHPGTWRDPICCSFEYESFDIERNENRPYSALSYVWGTSRVRENIQIDGHDCKISVNLACAIRNLRDERQLVRIWIDAICIDQDNIEERSAQVAMMRDIYARAQRVIVFMGDGCFYRIPQDYAKFPPPAPVSFSTFAQDAPLIEYFHNSWEKLCKRSEWYSFCTICVLRLLADVDGYKDTIHCIANGKAMSKVKLFELVRQFMNSQWWQRVWVIQESTVSPEVVIQYGNVKIPWAIIAKSASVCERLGWGRDDLGSESFLGIEREYAKVLPAFARQVFEIEKLRREWRHQRGSGLLFLLQEFSGRKATDDRDKVFALLGLASDIKTIEPDYSLTTVEVYRRTVIELIKQSRSLTAISGDMKRKNSGEIPSWIPDWSVAIEEPDYRRMQLEELCKIRPRWRIEVIRREQRYWELVERNATKLHEEIRTGKRKPLPKDIVNGLISYETILGTKMYGTEWKNEESFSFLQKEALRLCKAMYADFEQDRAKFFSTTPMRQFTDAHLSLPHTKSSGEWYRLDIIRWCSRRYRARILDMWFENLQRYELGIYDTSHSSLTLSDEQRERIVANSDWYFNADEMVNLSMTLDEYIRKTLPVMVEFIGHIMLYSTCLAKFSQRRRTMMIEVTSAMTISVRREHILTKPLTLSHDEGRPVDPKQLEILSDLLHLASEVLNVRTRSKTLLAIEQTKLACGALINLHHKNTTEPEDDYTTLFSTGVVFLGPATWMRCLRDNGPNKLDFAHEQFLESRRLKQRDALDEGENLLHISSRLIATVSASHERLISWVDPVSRIYTISQWALTALRKAKSGDFLLPFAMTLVGGLYEESPGEFRQFRRKTDTGLLRHWFVSSLLPRICDLHPGFDEFLSGWPEDKVELDITKSFDAEMRLAAEGRVFFTTSNYGMGLGPASMTLRDEVRILPGGNSPFVVRPNAGTTRGSSAPKYELIGDCYFFIDEEENEEGEQDSLQGCLPVEILGGLLCERVVGTDITLC